MQPCFCSLFPTSHLRFSLRFSSSLFPIPPPVFAMNPHVAHPQLLQKVREVATRGRCDGTISSLDSSSPCSTLTCLRVTRSRLVSVGYSALYNSHHYRAAASLCSQKPVLTDVPARLLSRSTEYIWVDADGGLRCKTMVSALSAPAVLLPFPRSCERGPDAAESFAQWGLGKIASRESWAAAV